MTQVIAVLFTALLASAQSISFEVASVKPAAPSAGRSSRLTDGADRIMHANTNLHSELARAYLVKGYQVAGPSWIYSERYDIVAKAPEGTRKDQIPTMLQTLLSERFQLVFHHENREMPVYALVAAKSFKLRETGDSNVGYDLGGGRRILKNHSMAQLSDFLSAIVQRPVLDRTEMQGTYNFPVDMSLEELGGVNANSEVSAPSIFTVLDGFGLKLESRKAPFDVIVVDSGNKVPTEN